MIALSALPERAQPQPDEVDQATTSTARPHLTPVPDPGHTSETPSHAENVRNRMDAVTSRLRTEFTPPDVWSKPRPSLREITHYGRYGQQIPDDGLARAASVAWSWLATVNATVAYAWQWVTERPSRTTVALVLVTLAALVPTTRAVLTVLLWPAHTGIELITNLD